MKEREAARRYRENERTVIINQSLTEPMPGVIAETTVEIIVKPSELCQRSYDCNRALHDWGRIGYTGSDRISYQAISECVR